MISTFITCKNRQSVD